MTKKFKMKWLGMMLIVIGITIPIISLAFSSNYHPKRGLIGNIQEMYVVINEGEPLKIPREGAFGETYYETIDEGRFTIDYKYLFAVGIILTILGIGLYATQSVGLEGKDRSKLQPPPESPEPPESSEPPKEPPLSGESSKVLPEGKKTNRAFLGTSFWLSVIIGGVVTGLTVKIFNMNGIYLGFLPPFILWLACSWAVKSFLTKE